METSTSTPWVTLLSLSLNILYVNNAVASGSAPLLFYTYVNIKQIVFQGKKHLLLQQKWSVTATSLRGVSGIPVTPTYAAWAPLYQSACGQRAWLCCNADWVAERWARARGEERWTLPASVCSNHGACCWEDVKIKRLLHLSLKVSRIASTVTPLLQCLLYLLAPMSQQESHIKICCIMGSVESTVCWAWPKVFQAPHGGSWTYMGAPYWIPAAVPLQRGSMQVELDTFLILLFICSKENVL